MQVDIKSFANYDKKHIMVGSSEFTLHPCFTTLKKVEGLTERRIYATLRNNLFSPS